MRMTTPEDDGQLAPHTINNLTKMAANLSGPARVRGITISHPCSLTRISEQKEYEEDFLKSKPTHYEYIRRLQRWRDRQEKYLDSRPRIQSLDLLSHYLTEFQYGKFDDIEVPGQYTEVSGSHNPSLKECLITRSGQGQQPELRSHPEIWSQV